MGRRWITLSRIGRCGVLSGRTVGVLVAGAFVAGVGAGATTEALSGRVESTAAESAGCTVPMGGRVAVLSASGVGEPQAHSAIAVPIRKRFIDESSRR
jgi:hypothetical protein